MTPHYETTGLRAIFRKAGRLVAKIGRQIRPQMILHTNSRITADQLRLIERGDEDGLKDESIW